jgi:WD40 repeat protein
MNAIKLTICGSLVILAGLMSGCTPDMSARMDGITTATTAVLPITQTAPATSPPATQTATRTPTGTRTLTVTATKAPTQTAVCIENVFVPQAFVTDSLLLVRKDSPEEGFGVQAIDLVSGEVESSLESPKMVYTTALSPDGKTLAWALEDNSIQLLTYPQGELLHSWEAHTQRIDDLKFSPDGHRLYSASYDNWFRVWDMQGELVDEFAPVGGEVHAIGVSPDGRLAAVVTFEGPQKLWDLESKQVVAELSPNGAFSPSEAIFTADGSMVGLSLGGFPVSLWTVPEGEQVWSGGNFSLALSQDGRYLAYSDVNEDGSYKVVIAAQDGSQILRTLEDLPSFAWNLLFSADGSLLVESSDVVRVWEVETGALLLEFKAECP